MVLVVHNNLWIPTAILSVVTCLLILVDPVLSEEGEDVGYSIIVPRRNLSCHECYKSVQGDACLTLTDRSRIKVRRCAVDELFCVVEKYDTDGALTTFSRKCAKDCTPGCQAAGTTFYKAQYCYHCCQKDLCNTVSSAAVSSGAAGGGVHGVVRRGGGVTLVGAGLVLAARWGVMYPVYGV